MECNRRREEVDVVQVILLFLVYLLLILALATWRSHHDAGRSKKNRRVVKHHSKAS
jgi:hypothetical protein